MSRSMTRADRLREMERLYVMRGFTDQELADRLGVTRSTVWKDRQVMAENVPLIDDGPGRFRVDRGRYISEVRLNLYEALTLYLAARRASRQTQMADLHATSALEKLARSLQQPMMERLVAAAETVPARRPSEDGKRIMESIARGWAERIVVNVVYRAFGADTTKTHRVRPYLIEPSQWSDSVYLIGHSHRAENIIAFKTERIERASLTTERFELPDDFDEHELFRHAWGIWTTGREPVEVRLKFTPGRATQRVKESVWHPLEEVSDSEDGGCIWLCAVDEWQEMLPWIRSWGADCEVLAPDALRAEMVAELGRLATVYG